MTEPLDDARGEPTELHRQAASMFFCWPTNAIDLAKKDSDLPELIEKLARFIAAWERKGHQRFDAETTGPTAEDIRACAWSTLIGFQHELGDSIDFICDQIARKATLTHSSTLRETPQ